MRPTSAALRAARVGSRSCRSTGRRPASGRTRTGPAACSCSPPCSPPTQECTSRCRISAGGSLGDCCAALVLAATTITRFFTSARWIPPLVAFGVSVLGVTIGFGGDTPWLGILPDVRDGRSHQRRDQFRLAVDRRAARARDAGTRHRAAAGAPHDLKRVRCGRRRVDHRLPCADGAPAADAARSAGTPSAPRSPTRSGSRSPPSCSSSSCGSADARPRLRCSG